MILNLLSFKVVTELLLEVLNKESIMSNMYYKIGVQYIFTVLIQSLISYLIIISKFLLPAEES